MRLSNARALRSCAVLAMAIAWGGGARTASAQASRSSTILELKDPTPRPPDLEKMYRPAGPPPGLTAAQITAYNQQRYQLIRHAAASMQRFANVLEKALAQHQEGTSLAQEAQVAGAIEALAANVCQSLAVRTETAPPASAAPGHTLPADKAHLLTDTQELAALTATVEAETAKSAPDALPVNVLLTSIRVRDLAEELQRRMQPH